MLYRGEDAQITSYLERAVTVGALRQRRRPLPGRSAAPEALQLRGAALGAEEGAGIDVMDAVGTNIRIDVRQRQVMRMLPRINEEVNEEWAHDKTRHHVDALVRNRLDRPWVREKGKLREASWSEALDAVRQAAEEGRGERRGDRRRPARRRECMRRRSCWRAWARPCSKAARPGRPSTCRAWPRCRSTRPSRGSRRADAILLVGANPRWEAPLVNTRIRKAQRKGAQDFRDRAGSRPRHAGQWIGNDLKLFGKLPKEVSDAFANAERPAVIVGAGALAANALGAALASRSRSSWSVTAGTASTSSTPPRRGWPA